MKFTSKITGMVKSTLGVVAAVSASTLAVASTYAAVPFSAMTPISISATNAATGGTGLMSYLATLIQNHFLLLFLFVGISLGIGFGLMIVRSVWHTKRG